MNLKFRYKDLLVCHKIKRDRVQIKIGNMYHKSFSASFPIFQLFFFLFGKFKSNQ